MRIRLALLVGLAVASAVAAATSSAAGEKTVRLLGTRGDVIAIAADGRHVAVATKIEKGCDRAIVWTAPTPAFERFDSKTACAGALFHDLPEIAVAGTRVAWVATTGGNHQDMVLETAILGTRKVSTLLFAENQAGAEGGVDGDWAGHLAGRGSLLVFNTWRECSVFRPEGSPPCEVGATAENVVYSRLELWKVTAGGKALLRTGRDAYAVAAVDAGRIAVRRVDGSVVLLGSAPRVEVAGPVDGVALQGNDLVTLEGDALQVYWATTGAAGKKVPLPSGKTRPVLRDVQWGIAVYVRGLQVHAVRLSDGKDVAIAVPGRGPVDAQIEPAGLYYSYNLPKSTAHGRVAFLSRAELLQKFH